MKNFILDEFVKSGNTVFNSAATLYHYTSVDVFRKILEDREFWVSNANFMNDEQEIMNGIELCRTVLKKKRGEYKGRYQAYFQSLLESCDRRTSSGVFNIHSENIFAMSFCSSGDILTQWQEYANGGISIGFRNAPKQDSERIMLKHADGTLTDMETVSVIYDDAEKERVLSEVIEIGIRLLDSNKNDNVKEVVMEMVSDALYQFFPAMKNRSFVHERESRFIYCAENQNHQEIKFREKRGILLPYVQLQITDPEGNPHAQLPIDDIVISPGPRINYVEKSVRYFLKESGYDYLQDKVRKSNIPYRV